jgi:transcriptional regulator with XRE-family HTH domain
MTDISYTNWIAMTDKALSEQLGAYIKHHRLQQNKTQEELATSAGISRSTLSLLEHGETVTLTTFIQVLRVLDLLNFMDSFKIESQISPIALAKMEQVKRQRARSKKEKLNDKSDW